MTNKFIVKSLSVFENKKIILENLSFILKDGDFLSIISKDSLDKYSLLLKSFIGLYKDIKGNIFFNDIDITKLDDIKLYELRTKLGYVFKKHSLISNMTILNNITLPLTYHSRGTIEEINSLAEKLIKEQNLENSMYKRPDDISVEEQKIALILRAHIINPDIVFYDNPIYGVKVYKYLDIFNIINNYHNRNRLIGVMLTDNLFFAIKLSTKILVLSDDGKILFYGENSKENRSKIYENCKDIVNSNIFGKMNVEN